ncbi:MAG TPA: DegQ family serine endoprotease [Rhodocyclaceae bacterium]|nr:DegQ family serine endoprotease [Rhodocyclaceae bacterium]HMZ84393.1 DegQ family serine endoprotease [Rhodocyclaceae bacterium]HNA04148.1 DegQ family serine endoprotease [Rhodocyclaceae bacterium]HNB79804.1 DegQ family serine endoprotease [Rhodocyclaceae bacterium]HNC62052.1 DegQ family serine endoprotease [Rhodocyclaceae bacterium]
MNRLTSRVAAVAAVSAVAFAFVANDRTPFFAQSHAVATAPSTASAPLVDTRGLPDFSTLVEAVGPAVVNISTQSVRAAKLEGGPSDEAMQEFLRRFGIPYDGQRQQPQQPRRGMGSGFIVSADGYVLTNAHVVADADEVTVKLVDKRDFKAKVIGSDKRTDVAVLKIDARDLPYVRMGDANTVKVGEWVVAVGSPFGFENSVTAGIVSAKARSLPDETLVPFIQTDVAINPGNSGGPLFNLRGEVVGINSQIYSRTGGFMGLSFAIPIDVAMKVSDQLRKTGKVTRGKMGVGIQPVTKELAESFGLGKAEGALVGSVENGSPAEKAGIQPGDVIVGVNGKPVAESADLPRIIGNMSPGDVAKIKVIRQGSGRELSVKLIEMNPEKMASAAEPDKKPASDKLGLAVRPLQPQEKNKLGIAGGLVVEDVAGPAARAGIQPGDVIVGLNSQPITDVEAFAKMVEASGNRLALLVQRGDARIFVPIKIG